MSSDASRIGRSRPSVLALAALVALLAIGAFAVSMRPARTTDLLDVSAAKDLEPFAPVDMADAVARVASTSAESR